MVWVPFLLLFVVVLCFGVFFGGVFWFSLVWLDFYYFF